MNTGTIFTTLLITLINFTLVFSSPTIHAQNISLNKNDTSCVNISNESHASIIIADFVESYIPKKNDRNQFSQAWMVYIFEGLISASVGTVIAYILLEILNIFFEDEIRIHGILIGPFMTILNEILLANEFAYKESQRQIDQYFNNNNNNHPKPKSSSRASAFVTRADR